MFKGENKLQLNRDAMQEVLADWIQRHQAPDVGVVRVTDVHYIGGSYPQTPFEVIFTLEEPKTGGAGGQG